MGAFISGKQTCPCLVQPMFSLPCPQTFVSHLIIMWGKFLQYSMISVWPPWGPPAVQQQRPHQNNCSCQLSSPPPPPPRVAAPESMTHRDTHTQNTHLTNCPWKRQKYWVGGLAAARPLPRPNWRTGYITLTYYPLMLQHLFSSRDSGGIWSWIVFFQEAASKLMRLNQLRLRKNAATLSVSQPPGGPRTAWPSDWSKISL